MKRWVYFSVSNPNGRLRFETLQRDGALEFAQGVFKSEGIICEIHEHERSST